MGVIKKVVIAISLLASSTFLFLKISIPICEMTKLDITNTMRRSSIFSVQIPTKYLDFPPIQSIPPHLLLQHFPPTSVFLLSFYSALSAFISLISHSSCQSPVIRLTLFISLVHHLHSLTSQRVLISYSRAMDEEIMISDRFSTDKLRKHFQEHTLEKQCSVATHLALKVQTNAICSTISSRPN